MICVTAQTYTDSQTDRFWLVILVAQPAGLKIVITIKVCTIVVVIIKHDTRQRHHFFSHFWYFYNHGVYYNPRSRVVIFLVASLCMSVCLSLSMSVCNTITFECVQTSFWLAGTSSGDAGQIRIFRSSGQGQGHRNKRRVCVTCASSKLRLPPPGTFIFALCSCWYIFKISRSS